MLEYLIILICVLIIYIFCTSIKKFNYWKNKNVPYLKPLPILGNYKDYLLLKKSVGIVAQNICKQFPDEPYVGVFYGTEPALLVQDPEILKTILIKDFYYFSGREASNFSDREAITKSIFFTGGDDWKIIRQNLTPLYSTAKMKQMFPLIEKCAQDFTRMLKFEISDSKVIETNRLMARYTIHCVASAAFGIDTDVMDLKESDYINSPFIKMGDQIFKNSDYRGYKLIARAIWPKWFYTLGFQLFPMELKYSLLGLVKSVIEERGNKPSLRHDFVDLMITLKQSEYLYGDSLSAIKTGKHKTLSVKIDDELIAGQVASFYGGAFETSATTLTLTALELAKNQDVQRRVQKEVDEYLLKNGGSFNYNCVTDLPYLAACVDETLRLYPVFTVLTREVMENITLPTGLHLDKGVRVHIPLYHIQRNPKNFPEPNVYRPERFLPEEKHNIKPFTYMPFGEGPRLCIGMRFSRMQVYTGLITILRDFNIGLVDGKLPSTDFDPRWLVSHTLGEINLMYEPRKN